jgi:hypothetical protein
MTDAKGSASADRRPERSSAPAPLPTHWARPMRAHAEIPEAAR